MDRDIIEVQDGSFFMVVGSIHPPDKVISFPKYIAGGDGIWSNGYTKYIRAFNYYSALEVYHACKKYYPKYLIYDKILDSELFEVPNQDIKVHYIPEKKLNKILSNPRDPLQTLTVKLVSCLSNLSGVSTESFGITGSILIDIHNTEFSDIDLIVYGKENTYLIKDTLIYLLNNEKHGFSRLKGKRLIEYAMRINEAHPLSISEATNLYRNVFWNRGLFNDKFFSIHPVPRPNEILEKYGDKLYKKLGIVEIEARVVNSDNAIFTPVTYEVDNVKIIEGPKINDITEIVSYEGLYMDIAQSNDKIRVLGRLEMVYDKRKKSVYYRVVVGSIDARGKDYIRVVK